MNKTIRSKQSTPIIQRLTAIIDSINVDIFGYEKLVNQNVQRFIEETASKAGVNPQTLFVRIVKPGQSLRVFLHSGAQQIEELTIKDLVLFFVGSSSVVNPATVADRVISFMDAYAHEKTVDVSRLQILISSQDKHTLVKSFCDQEFVEDIPLKQLINQFKS